MAEKISLNAADESVDIEGGVEDRAIATTIDGATEETSTGKRIVEKEISEVMKECAIVIEGVEMGHVANPNTSSSVEASSSKWKRPKKIMAEDVFADAAADTTPTTNSNRIASCSSGTSIASLTGFCGREKEDAESQLILAGNGNVEEQNDSCSRNCWSKEAPNSQIYKTLRCYNMALAPKKTHRCSQRSW